MKVIGLDIGSITTKLVILDGSKVFYQELFHVSDRSETVAKKAMEHALAATSLKRNDIDFIVATGHSRENVPFVDLQKTTYLCLYKGGIEVFPHIRTIVDVGAENATVVSMDGKGRVKEFVTNDKCAAGGGIFIEAMAKALGLSLDELAEEAMKADKAINITSTCTIFAEQEVLSYTFEDPPPSRPEIVAGIHASLASRVVGLVMKVVPHSPVLLCGGVALNRAFVETFTRMIKLDTCVPEKPQFVAALGAATFGRHEILGRKKGEHARSRT